MNTKIVIASLLAALTICLATPSFAQSSSQCEIQNVQPTTVHFKATVYEYWDTMSARQRHRFDEMAARLNKEDPQNFRYQSGWDIFKSLYAKIQKMPNTPEAFRSIPAGIVALFPSLSDEYLAAMNENCDQKHLTVLLQYDGKDVPSKLGGAHFYKLSSRKVISFITADQIADMKAENQSKTEALASANQKVTDANERADTSEAKAQAAKTALANTSGGLSCWFGIIPIVLFLLILALLALGTRNSDRSKQKLKEKDAILADTSLRNEALLRENDLLNRQRSQADRVTHPHSVPEDFEQSEGLSEVRVPHTGKDRTKLAGAQSSMLLSSIDEHLRQEGEAYERSRIQLGMRRK